jgi:fatty acid desaturase
MNMLHEPIILVKHPNTHVIIKPAPIGPLPEYTKEDRRKDRIRVVKQLLRYIGFIILMLVICIMGSLLLAGTKWFGIWMMVCLFLGWLASALGELFFLD